MSNGPYARLCQTSKFHHQFSFGYSFELFCFSWEFIYSNFRKFTISKRVLVKFARLTLTRRASYYHGPLTLQPLKYIPLVAIDRRENSCGIFYHYYFTWIDTRLIKHINLPGLALSQGQLTKIKKFPIYALTLPPWLQNKVEISLHNYERSNLAGVVSNKQNDSLVESNCLAFFWILL